MKSYSEVNEVSERFLEETNNNTQRLSFLLIWNVTKLMWTYGSTYYSTTFARELNLLIHSTETTHSVSHF